MPIKTPTPRCLDIYRLVVVRGWSQLQTAETFGVSTPRLCQVVRRVRTWVNASIGEWLFPGRDDLRFYTALQCVLIRVQEFPHDPEHIFLAGPGWTYTRHTTTTCGAGVSPATPTRSVSEDHPTSTTPPIKSPNIDANLITPPINSLPVANLSSSAASPSSQTDFDAQMINDLAPLLAQFLIDWRKTRNITTAIKSSAY